MTTTDREETMPNMLRHAITATAALLSAAVWAQPITAPARATGAT